MRIDERTQRNEDTKFHAVGAGVAALAAVATLAALSALAPGAARADSRRLALDPAKSEVSIELPATGHDVHGVFHLKSGAVVFDEAAGTASGELVVDAGSGETGNGSRDKTMREDVLETPKFPEIRFVAERFHGALPVSGSADVELAGKIFVHGAGHPLTMKAKVTAAGESLTAETSFPVPFLEWGMKDPSFLFFKVGPIAQVKVKAAGTLAPAAVATEARANAGGE